MNPDSPNPSTPSNQKEATSAVDRAIPLLVLPEATLPIPRTSARNRQSAWEGFWAEHLRKGREEPKWPLEARLKSFAHLEREYIKLRKGGETPSPADSEIGLSQADVDDKRLKAEIDTYQAFSNERNFLNGRLKSELNTTYTAWHEKWTERREKREKPSSGALTPGSAAQTPTSGARTPEWERAESNLEYIRARIGFVHDQLAKLPDEERDLETQLNEIRASKDDPEAQQALNKEITALREQIAPLERRVDREIFSEEDKQLLINLNDQLTEALARQPQRLREKLEAELFEFRGSVEIWSMGRFGRREDLIQELRVLRDSQLQIMRDSRTRRRAESPRRGAITSGIDDAAIGEVEAEVSRELLHLLRVQHNIRCEWLATQASLTATENELVSGQDGIEFWQEPVARSQGMVAELQDNEKAFATALDDAEGSALDALGTIEQTALTNTTKVNDFFREQARHPALVHAVQLYQTWKDRSVLGPRDLQQMQEEARAFRDTRTNRLSMVKTALSENHNNWRQWEGRVTEWKSELEGITPLEGWRQTMFDMISDLPQEFVDNNNEVQTLRDEMSERQQKMLDSHQTPAPTDIQELKRQLSDSLRFDADTNVRLNARYTVASFKGAELSQFAGRIQRQAIRFKDLQEVKAVHTRNERRLGEALKNGSLSTQEHDDRLRSVRDVQNKLDALDAETLAVFDNLRQINDQALDDVTQPLEKRIVELQGVVNTLSGELDVLELNDHLAALPNLQSKVSTSKGSVTQLNVRFMGVVNQIGDTIDEPSNPLTAEKEVVDFVKGALSEIQSEFEKSKALPTEIDKWVDDVDGFLSALTTTDVESERARLTEARNLRSRERRMRKMFNSLGAKQRVYANKASWLEEQVQRLKSVIETENLLKQQFDAVHITPEFELSDDLEDVQARLENALGKRLDETRNLRTAGVAFCKRIFAEVDNANIDLQGIQEQDVASLSRAREELSSRVKKFQSNVATEEIALRSNMAGHINGLLGAQETDWEDQEEIHRALGELASALVDTSVGKEVREQFTALQKRRQTVEKTSTESASLSDLKAMVAELNKQGKELKEIATQMKEQTLLARRRLEERSRNVHIEAASTATQTGAGLTENAIGFVEPEAAAIPVAGELQEESRDPEPRPKQGRRLSGFFGKGLKGILRSKKKEEGDEAQSRNKQSAETQGVFRKLFRRWTVDSGAGASTTFGALTNTDRNGMQEKGIDPRQVRDVRVDESVGSAVYQMENGNFVYSLNTRADTKSGKNKAQSEHVMVPAHVVDNAKRTSDALNQIKGLHTDKPGFKVTAALMTRSDTSPSRQSTELSAQSSEPGKSRRSRTQ